jgi:hypothetical protein
MRLRARGQFLKRRLGANFSVGATTELGRQRWLSLNFSWRLENPLKKLPSAFETVVEHDSESIGKKQLV